MCSVRRSAHTALFAALLAVSLSISPRSAAFAAAPSESAPAQGTSTDAPTDTPSNPDAPEQANDPAPANQDDGDGALPLLSEEPAATEQPANTSGGALPLLPDPETPAIARDVGVEELPLLVTEPPAAQDEVAIPAPVTGGSDSALNPFSPLLLPQTAEPAPPAASPVAAEPAAPAPAPTSAQPPPVATSPAEPTPRAAAPAAPVPPARAGRPTLPRSLGASLRAPASAVSNPRADPLGRALNAQIIGEDDAPAPSSSLAAIRAPSSLTPLGTAPTAAAATAPIPSSAQQVALGSGLSTLGLGNRGNANDGNFTSLGGNRVSRALSSLQVHFTAMATGTAIFRVGNDTMPVLLALGESLPGTELKLTNLTSRGAEFTEDDVRHTLFLTP